MKILHITAFDSKCTGRPWPEYCMSVDLPALACAINFYAIMQPTAILERPQARLSEINHVAIILFMRDAHPSRSYQFEKLWRYQPTCLSLMQGINLLIGVSILNHLSTSCPALATQDLAVGCEGRVSMSRTLFLHGTEGSTSGCFCLS